MSGQSRPTNITGHGGCTDIEPAALFDHLQAYAKTLPPKVSEDLRDPNDKSKPFTYPQDAESLIDDAFSAWFDERERKRIRSLFEKDMRDRIVWVMPNGALMQTKKLTPAQRSGVLVNPEWLAKREAEGARILNTMERAEAWEIWHRGVVGEPAKSAPASARA